MNGKREILDGRPWVCTEEQQAWLDEVRWGFGLLRPRQVTAVQENRGDITLFRYDPQEQAAEMQREQELTERFRREGGIVYLNGKPWARALPAEPKPDRPGEYTAELIPLSEDWKP